jgi:16S rRNA pseudouridine516 synthase
VGRLDADTTGLLLLSDDGQFIHKMSSPKTHLPKVYHATLAEPITDKLVNKLLTGVQLVDERQPLQALAAEALGEHLLSMSLTEGKYHQVKRMVAACGNHVVALQRVQIGGLLLPADLAPGQWRWLSEADLAALKPNK